MISCTPSSSKCIWLNTPPAVLQASFYGDLYLKAVHRQESFCAGGRLHQQPVPELVQLRVGDGVHMASLQVEEGAAAALPQIRGPSVDVSLRLARGSCSAAGILLRAWLHADADSKQPSAAAAIVDWDRGTLEARTLGKSLQSRPWQSCQLAGPNMCRFWLLLCVYTICK